jgi:hypothetical protein
MGWMDGFFYSIYFGFTYFARALEFYVATDEQSFYVLFVPYE